MHGIGTELIRHPSIWLVESRNYVNSFPYRGRNLHTSWFNLFVYFLVIFGFRVSTSLITCKLIFQSNQMLDTPKLRPFCLNDIEHSPSRPITINPELNCSRVRKISNTVEKPLVYIIARIIVHPLFFHFSFCVTLGRTCDIMYYS